jgi:hypothetical protein
MRVGSAVTVLPPLAAGNTVVTFVVLGAFVTIMFALAWWVSNHVRLDVPPPERESVVMSRNADEAAADEES